MIHEDLNIRTKKDEIYEEVIFVIRYLTSKGFYAVGDQSDDDTIDLGSVEQGWLTGGIITLTAQSATRWHCAAHLHGDGTLATPFE